MDLLIFDLDGTLIDSKLDLANAVNAAREHLGLPSIENELVYSYVGNGAPVLIRRALGPEATEEECRKALEYFFSYYRLHMLDHTRLYAGVREALDRFLEKKMKMAVLTNKPVRFSEALVEGLGLQKHFLRVYGGNSFQYKKPHPIGVEMLIEESGTNKTGAMIVGDSAVDVQTARNAGIQVCGVTYGFQPEGFRDDPPDLVVDNMMELAEKLLGAEP